MSETQPGKPVYQFGHFEVVPETGELYRLGRRVKIQELPFRVLVTLLKQQGEIVSRDILAKQLWPDKTFVEFDQGLSVAVRKLRQAIGDVAENPRFIETVPRRGYRFIAPVTNKARPRESADVPLSEPVAAMASTHAAPASQDVAQDDSARSRRTLPHVGRYWMWAAGIAFLAAAIVGGYRFDSQLHEKPVLHENDRMVLTDFDNATGDTVFDDTLNSALRVKLDESPFFTLASRAATRTALSKLGHPGTHLSAQEAQQVCREDNAQAIVHGSVAREEGALRLRLQVDSCVTGRPLVEEEVLSPSREMVLSQLGEAADRLRHKLGEPDTSIQRFGTPLTQATTSSFSALKAFAAGEEKRAQGEDHETIADYKLATDLDPEFATAYARLGAIYGNENEGELAHAAYQKAFDLRMHTTERERLYLTAHYYASASGDLERAVEVYQLWRQLYPRDLIAPNNLADTYETLGKPNQALLMAQAAHQISPDHAFPYSGMLQAEQRLGRYQEARDTWREATAKKLDNAVISRMAMLRVGFAEGDDALVQQQLDWARGNPREGEFLLLSGWIKAASGHLREAQVVIHRAQEVAIANGLSSFAAEAGEDLAQFESDFGENAPARAEVQRSLVLAPKDSNVEAFAAMILAGANEARQAEALIQHVQAAAPQDTVFNQMILPMAEARLSMTRSDPGRAVHQLEPLTVYDLSRVTELAMIFYRAQALLAAGEGVGAQKEFQRLLDLRAICPITPYLPLAHLGIARSRKLSGDLEGSRAAYVTFLEEWKDADSDLPVLRQARAEFAHLSAPAK